MALIRNILIIVTGAIPALVLSGCLSFGGDKAPVESREEAPRIGESEAEIYSKEARPTFIYRDDLSTYIQMMEMTLEQTGGPFDHEVETTEISGDEAWRFLEIHQLTEPLEAQANKALSLVINDPSARAFHLRGIPEEGSPVEAILIPWPESREDEDLPELIAAQAGPGVFLFLGIESLESEDVERPGPKIEIPPLKAQEFQRLIEERPPFVVLLHAPGCGASASVFDTLSALELPPSLPLYQVQGVSVFGEHFKDDFRSLPYPSLIAFSESQWVDIHIGANIDPLTDSLLHFFSRQGHIEEEMEPFIDVEFFSSQERMVRTLTVFNHWSSLSLPGQELRGLRLSGGSLAGSNLQGADLRGADLRGAFITKTQLRGANLEGARLEGAKLRDVECIDGSIHSGGPEGCLLL